MARNTGRGTRIAHLLTKHRPRRTIMSMHATIKTTLLDSIEQNMETGGYLDPSDPADAVIDGRVDLDNVAREVTVAALREAAAYVRGYKLRGQAAPTPLELARELDSLAQYHDV